MKENAKKQNEEEKLAALETCQCRLAFVRWTNLRLKKSAASTHWIKSVEKQTCSNLKHIIILSIHKCLKSVSRYEHIHPFTS